MHCPGLTCNVKVLLVHESWPLKTVDDVVQHELRKAAHRKEKKKEKRQEKKAAILLAHQKEKIQEKLGKYAADNRPPKDAIAIFSKPLDDVIDLTSDVEEEAPARARARAHARGRVRGRGQGRGRGR